MTGLSEKEFVLRAVERVPNTDSRHVGLRLSVLRSLFAAHFADTADLPDLLDEMIRDGELVAAQLTWTEKPASVNSYYWKAKVDQVARLRSFPDAVIVEENPILYLAGRFPDRLKGRLGKVQGALDKILAD